MKTPASIQLQKTNTCIKFYPISPPSPYFRSNVKFNNTLLHPVSSTYTKYWTQKLQKTEMEVSETFETRGRRR